MNEAEIEAPLSRLGQTVELLAEVIQRIPRISARAETTQTAVQSFPRTHIHIFPASLIFLALSRFSETR